MRAIAILAAALILFNGCAERKKYIHVRCPKLYLLDRPAKVEITVDENGSISGPSVKRVFRLCNRLRRDNDYYRSEIIEYNAKFAERSDK